MKILRQILTITAALALLSQGSIAMWAANPRSVTAANADMRGEDSTAAVAQMRGEDSTVANAQMRGEDSTAAIPDSIAAGEDSLSVPRLLFVGGTMAAANIAIATYYFTTFYNDDYAKRAPFHTFNDWYNADLNVDKFGHIWGSQTYSVTLYHMFRWTRMNKTSSMYWSSGLAFFFQLQMELTDGMYQKWGYSWWDMTANAIGSTWPNLQRVYPSLQSFNLKMSYHPSENVHNGWVEHDYLRDYDGFTYWLSFSVHDFLPRSLKPYWPSWLALAVGYGANNTMLGKNIFNSVNGRGMGQQEIYIALDYDLRKIPGDSAFMQFVKEALNLFHWPSPAIRISPSVVYYGLYF